MVCFLYVSHYTTLRYLHTMDSKSKSKSKVQLKSKFQEQNVPGTRLKIGDLVSLLPSTEESDAFKMWQELLASPQGAKISFQLFYELSNFVSESMNKINEEIGQAENAVCGMHSCKHCQDDIDMDASAISTAVDDVKQMVQDFNAEKETHLSEEIAQILSGSPMMEGDE